MISFGKLSSVTVVKFSCCTIVCVVFATNRHNSYAVQKASSSSSIKSIGTLSNLKTLDSIAQKYKYNIVAPYIKLRDRLTETTGDSFLDAYAIAAGGQVSRSGSIVVISLQPQRLSKAIPNYLRSPKAISQAGFQLIQSLDDKQINQMYKSSFVDAKWLKPEQHKSYINLMRRSILGSVLDVSEVLSDQEILDLPVKFMFASTASMRLTSPQNKGYWLGVFDYGRGPLHLVASSPSSSRVDLLARSSAFVVRTRSSAELKPSDGTLAKGKEIEISESLALPLNQILSLIKSKGGVCSVILDKRLRGKQLNIVVTKGLYSEVTLIQSLATALGLEARSVSQKLLFIGEKTNLDVSFSPIAKTKLQRLRLPSNLPFGAEFFDQKRVVPFSKLSPEQQNYVRLRLKAEEYPGLERLDLAKYNVEFGNTTWFQGAYFGTEDKPELSTFEVQL